MAQCWGWASTAFVGYIMDELHTLLKAGSVPYTDLPKPKEIMTEITRCVY